MRMSTVAPPQLLTADEFAHLPQPEDGSQQELVRGVVITMPPPSFYHGLCCNEIGYRLNKHVRDLKLGHITTNDSGVILERDPDTVRGPDLAFWSRERMPTPPTKGYSAIPPDLVVEVLSPSDVYARVEPKVLQYLRAGVRMVWILVPEDRSIFVRRTGHQGALLSNGEMLTGEDVLPGFSCPVSELFP
jgi:Uma2 family endonuclease